METTFKYNGKIISTPNLEKKLKRMKISITDIEIVKIPKEIKIEKEEEDDEYENVNLVTPLDNIKRVIRVPKGTRPNPAEYLSKYIWNNNVGIKEFTKEFLNTLKYEE